MAIDHRSRCYIRAASVVALAAAMLFLSSGVSYAGTVDAPDHGLSYEKAPLEASPAMTSFFQGSGATALPEAAAGRNGTTPDPIWDLAGQAARADAGVMPESVGGSGAGGGGGSAARKVLIAAGITFGVLGLGFLAGAAVVYAKHVRRTARARAAAREDAGRFHHLELL